MNPPPNVAQANVQKAALRSLCFLVHCQCLDTGSGAAWLDPGAAILHKTFLRQQRRHVPAGKP